MVANLFISRHTHQERDPSVSQNLFSIVSVSVQMGSNNRITQRFLFETLFVHHQPTDV